MTISHKTSYDDSTAEKPQMKPGHSNDRRQIKDAAKKVGVSSKELGKAVHSEKKKRGLKPSENLTWVELIELAQALV